MVNISCVNEQMRFVFDMAILFFARLTSIFIRVFFGFPWLGLSKDTLLNSNKFAFCTRFLPPMWSGQAVVIKRLLMGLNSKQYCLVSRPVYDRRSDYDFVGALPAKYHDLQKEVQITVFSMNKLIRWINLFIGIIQRGVNIARALKNEKVNVLVVGTGDQIDPAAACLASSILGCKFFVYFFDDYIEQFWEDTDMRPLIIMLERIIVRRSSGAIVPNEYMQQVLIKRYNHVSDIVRNPCPREEVNEKPCQKEKGVKSVRSEEIRLVFTGAIYKLNYDAFRVIISAIEKITYMNVKLHLYTAQSFEVLKSEGLHGDKVVLHAHVPPAEVKFAQRNADILLIPFSFDPRAMGIIKSSATAKLADYLMSEKPILAICPKDSFLNWYFTKHNCGVVVSEESDLLIQKAILNIIQNNTFRKTICRNAGHRAEIETF
jgi:hypothetical protein